MSGLRCNLSLNNKLFMKNLLLFFALFFALGQTMAQDKEVIDRVIGTVGGELILLSEVEEQFTLMEQQRGGGLPSDQRCVILESLVASKLLLNQAKLDSIEVSEEEVDQQLDARVQNILSYMNNDISQFEAYYGQSVNDVKEDFREDLRNRILTDRMRGDIITSANVTPSEVKSFFARIPTDSLPYFNSEVEIGEIVHPPQVNAEQKKIAREKLDELRRRIVEDEEDFAELARIFSDDPGSARTGGDLGMQRRGTFVTEFEATAYNLEVNEISEVIETEFGFHILQLLERRGNNVHIRHILVKSVITEADRTLAMERLDSVRHLLMADSISFSLAVKRFSDENQQSFNNDGSLMNPKTGNTFFEIGDLEPDIYFTIDTMGVNTYSSPLPFKSPAGEEAFRIIVLKSRTEPHKASLEKDYSKIKQATLEEKKNKFINDWVMEKISSTYINIEKSYQGCPNLQDWMAEQ